MRSDSIERQSAPSKRRNHSRRTSAAPQKQDDGGSQANNLTADDDFDDTGHVPQRNRMHHISKPTNTIGSKRKSIKVEQTSPVTQQGRCTQNQDPAIGQSTSQDQENNVDTGEDEDTAPFQYPVAEIDTLRHKVVKAEEEYQTQRQASNLNVSDREFNSMVGSAFRFMLFSYYHKPGALVEQVKLTGVFMADFNDLNRRKVAPVVIAATQHKLLSVAGIQMVEVLRRAATTKAGARDDDVHVTKTYRLQSALPAAVSILINPPNVNLGFISLVLALIRMSGGKLSEERLYEFLSQLGIHQPSHPGVAIKHPKLGSIQDHLTTMVTNRYVTCIRSMEQSSDGNGVNVYQWGEVAAQELGEATVEAFIKETCNAFQTGS